MTILTIPMVLIVVYVYVYYVSSYPRTVENKVIQIKTTFNLFIISKESILEQNKDQLYDSNPLAINAFNVRIATLNTLPNY